MSTWEIIAMIQFITVLAVVVALYFNDRYHRNTLKALKESLTRQIHETSKRNVDFQEANKVCQEYIETLEKENNNLRNKIEQASARKQITIKNGDGTVSQI